MDDSDRLISVCDCGRPRNLGTVELQCMTCGLWFHSECLSIRLSNCLPFMTNYVFYCKGCNPSGRDFFQKKQATYAQLCLTSLANLTHVNRHNNRKLFSKDRDIILYIEKNWERMTPSPRRPKVCWHPLIGKFLSKEHNVFLVKESPSQSLEFSEGQLYGLVESNLQTIGPYFALSKLPVSRDWDDNGITVVVKTMQQNGGSTVGKRGTKRKPVSETSLMNKRSRNEPTQKLPSHGFPLEHPFNKDGYRYTLAEPDPFAPLEDFDQPDQICGTKQPIPAHVYKVSVHHHVLLSLHDRAPQIKISEGRLTATGEKGYSMVRSSHAVSEGSWFFEIYCQDLPECSACRLGWSQDMGNLQAPLGYDKFSYSWRSRRGTIFHESHGKHYTDDSFETGDTLGFYIHLPRVKPLLPPTKKDQALIKFKSFLYFEEKEEPQEAEKLLTPLPGSEIIFYKNGVCKGAAFKDVYGGAYYPAISLYKNASMRINYGPKFRFEPHDCDYRPFSEVSRTSMISQLMSDMLFHVDYDITNSSFL